MIKAGKWLLYLILIVSLGINFYLWQDGKRKSDFWLSNNVTILVSDVRTASGSIQSLIKTGDMDKHFAFGVALEDLRGASTRANHLSSSLGDPFNSHDWSILYNTLDRCMLNVGTLHNEYSNNHATALTAEQSKRLQAIKAYLDEYSNVLQDQANYNVSTGRIDENAMRKLVQASEKLNQDLGTK